MKFITILLGLSLAFAFGAQAEQDDHKKKSAPKSKPVQQQPQVHHAPNQQRPVNPHGPAPYTQHQPKTNAYQQNPNVTKQHHVPSSVQTKKMPPTHTNQPPTAQTNELPAVHKNRPPTAQTNQLPSVQSNKPVVRPNPETVQRVKAQHVDFHARPNTAVASVQFNQHYRIRGAENWHGAHYDVFRTYHPVWHERGWWHSHYPTVVLIGGGWYFWNAGYWFPAWGYDTAAAYYPYDGPIYAGSSARPFDQVVADVQGLLQEQGYYRGEVDGLLGPLTRDALAAFQQDHGLIATAAVDEPTLDALGLS